MDILIKNGKYQNFMDFISPENDKKSYKISIKNILQNIDNLLEINEPLWFNCIPKLSIKYIEKKKSFH